MRNPTIQTGSYIVGAHTYILMYCRCHLIHQLVLHGCRISQRKLCLKQHHHVRGGSPSQMGTEEGIWTRVTKFVKFLRNSSKCNGIGLVRILKSGNFGIQN
jgi:hypothetical protein